MAQFTSAFVGEPELLKALEPHSHPVDLSQRQILFHEGEPSVGVYILRSGAARLTSHSELGEVLDVLAAPGSLLGIPAVVGAKAYSLRADALEGAEVAFVSSQDFVNLMQTQPQLSFQVVRVLAEEVRFARETVGRL